MKARLFAALAVLLATFAQPAAAVVMLATYTGTVYQPGGPLDGKNFTATYRYDTSIGRSTAGTTDSVGGGIYLGPTAPIPIQWVTMQIEGASIYDVAKAPLTAMGVNSDSSGYITHWVQDDAPGIDGWTVVAFVELQGIASPGANLEVPFSSTVYDFAGRGHFYYSLRDPSGTEQRALDVGLRPTYITVMAVAVPEPGSWAMMILGFGLIGGTMRRRKRVLAVA